MIDSFPNCNKTPSGLGRSVLTAHHALPPEDVPDYGSVTSIHLFDGGALAMGVASLAECTLYKSTGNTNVGEFFLVCHHIRRVFFNTSLSKTTDHSLKKSKVQKVVDGLKLQQNSYKLVVVYVRSNNLDIDCGLRFSVPVVNKTGGNDTETHTLKEMHAMGQLKEVESCVVRANFYPKSSTIMPQKYQGLTLPQKGDLALDFLENLNEEEIKKIAAMTEGRERQAMNAYLSDLFNN